MAQHIQETFDSCSHPGDKYSHQNKHSSETNEHHVLMHCIYMMQFKFLVCLSSEFSSSELPSNTKLEFQACTSLMVPFWCQLIAQSSHSANSNTSPCVTPTLATARQGWDQEDWNYVKKVVVVFLNPLNSKSHSCLHFNYGDRATYLPNNL